MCKLCWFFDDSKAEVEHESTRFGKLLSCSIVLVNHLRIKCYAFMLEIQRSAFFQQSYFVAYKHTLVWHGVSREKRSAFVLETKRCAFF
mmetsp:Transcript_68208/g.101352  ORF Transcript_68208/g.101352 Transcript_68208/m.101352 type:complete len:89 (-) Transcript_68208:395-661(-)